MKYLLVFFAGGIGSFFLVSTLFFAGTSKTISEPIHFQTADGHFSYKAIPSKGRDYVALEAAYALFLEENKVERQDIYRVTRMNYLSIGKWARYKSMPEWQYPYLPKWKRA